MPIATPQGTLDFKSVDKVTFVGASSNTVIDTTTASLGVGVGVGGPTSNLHVVGHTRLEGDIDMLHTANTASIKLNSNVVTEFPRSKKLIKYPRVAMTQNDESATSGYVASASSINANYPPWEAFDGSTVVTIATNDHTFRWQTETTSPTRYTSSGGGPWVPTTSFTDNLTTISNGSTIRGDWLQLESPDKVNVKSYHIYNSTDYVTDYNAHTVVLLGSNTGIDDWVDVGSGERELSWSNFTSTTNGNHLSTVAIENTPGNMGFYRYHRLIVRKVTNQHLPVIFQLELFGLPEYDSEAHGTDMVVKSVPNVPNTDWLDIYIDGQDYSTMPSGNGSVLDKSTNNRHGTPSNVTFNSTWKAFEIESASTSNITIPFNSTGGAYVHTISLWFWMDTTAGGNRCIFTIRGSESTGRQIALIINQDTTSVGFKYDFYGSDVRHYDPSVVANKWMHVTLTYSGGNDTAGSKEIYLNGTKLSVKANGTSPLNLTGTENLIIGGDLNSSNASFEGMVANFRMFNRVLTTDEIYQLYAYQKEYFGHGDLGMTLKAGRLGIGTSEPRAALDVKGRITREYNPGEIIETIQGKANGRYVKVQSGTYLLPNVGTYQDLTSTHTRITGSNFEYTPPPGTTRVIYEFWCFMRQGDPRPILHFQGRVDGTIVNDSRHTYRDTSMTTDHDPQKWIYNHMCVSIGEVASDNIAGGQVATWNSPRSIDFTAREYSDSYEGRLHNTNHWDGGGSDILVRPTIKITAIA